MRELVPPYTNLPDCVELFSCPPISKIPETLSLAVHSRLLNNQNNKIEEVALVVHLKSTKIGVSRSVLKRIWARGKLYYSSSALPSLSATAVYTDFFFPKPDMKTGCNIVMVL